MTFGARRGAPGGWMSAAGVSSAAGLAAGLADSGSFSTRGAAGRAFLALRASAAAAASAAARSRSSFSAAMRAAAACSCSSRSASSSSLP